MNVNRKLNSLSLIKHYYSANGLGHTKPLNKRELETVIEEFENDVDKLTSGHTDRSKDFSIEKTKDTRRIDYYEQTKNICAEIDSMLVKHSKYIQQLFQIYYSKK